MLEEDLVVGAPDELRAFLVDHCHVVNKLQRHLEDFSIEVHTLLGYNERSFGCFYFLLQASALLSESIGGDGVALLDVQPEQAGLLRL